MIDSVAGSGKSLEQLLKLFDEYQLKVSFFVSSGPDRNVPLLRRAGGKGLIANERDNLLAIEKAGHDVGLGVYDPAGWKRAAATAKEDWIQEQWQRGMEGWMNLYGTAPAAHAAAGFQVHPRLFSLEQQTGMAFSSDVYGQTPFLPELLGTTSTCIQLPVTLPSTAELMARKGVTKENLHEELYDASQKIFPQGQHWRIVAGEDDPSLIEAMIVMWRGSSREFVTLSQVGENVLSSGLRQHRVGWHNVGDDSYVAMQSLPVDD